MIMFVVCNYNKIGSCLLVYKFSCSQMFTLISTLGYDYLKENISYVLVA